MFKHMLTAMVNIQPVIFRYVQFSRFASGIQIMSECTNQMLLIKHASGGAAARCFQQCKPVLHDAPHTRFIKRSQESLVFPASYAPIWIYL